VLIGISWIVFFPMSAFGQLLVSDYFSNQVLEYNLDGSSRGVFQAPSPPTYISSPAGMAFGNGTDLFVSSLATGEVLRYNWATGAYLGVFASVPNGPSGLLFDRAKNLLYVSEYGGGSGNEIDCYSASSGTNPIAQFGYAQGAQYAGMAMGSDGKLYVSDWSDGKIMIFDPANNYSAGDPIEATYLYNPNGLVFDPSGYLYVAGMGLSNVYKFNSSGAMVGNGPLVSGLNWPSGIAIDPDGNLIVSSMGDYTVNGYIDKYDSTTGAPINPNSKFITFSESTQPTALLVEPALWTGSAGIYWNNSANWHGTPPVYQGDIRFGAVKTGGYITNNNFDQWTQFNGITFISDANASSYTLQGNAIKLGGPVVNQSANDQEIDLAMELVPGGGAFDTGGHNITVGGLISGAGSLTKKGGGTLSLVGGVSYSGSTTVTEGTLDIAGPLCNSPTIDVEGAGSELLAQSIVADTLTIGAGATVVIKAIPEGPLCLQSIQAVPEPGTMALLLTLGAMAPLIFLPRRRKT
jgi:autotransporter-associated beta strand protein